MENIDGGDQKTLRVLDTVPVGFAVSMQPPGRVGTAWGDHAGAIDGDKAARAPGMPKHGLQCLHAEDQGMQDISQHGSGQFAASRADGSQGWDRRPSEIPAPVGTKEPQAPTVVGRCAVRLRSAEARSAHCVDTSDDSAQTALANRASDESGHTESGWETGCYA